MTDLALALIVSALLLFVGGWWTGRRFADAFFWRYIDPVYYVLGACGLILIALSVERNLVAERLEQQERATEDAWKERPNNRPNAHFQNRGRELIDVSFGGLKTVVEQAKLCAYGHKYDCSISEPVRDELERAFKGFSGPSGSDETAEARYEQDYCLRSLRFVNSLSARDDLLDGRAFEELRHTLSIQSKTHVSAEQGLAILTTRIDRSQNFYRVALGHKDEELTEALFAGFKSYALFAFRMVDFCTDQSSTNTEAIALLERWESEETRRAQVLSNFRRELNFARNSNARTPAQLVSGAIHNSVWPFVLLLAAAIKFAKSIADIHRAGSNRQTLRSQAVQTEPAMPAFYQHENNMLSDRGLKESSAHGSDRRGEGITPNEPGR